jgi:hypothetical protein
MSLGKGTLYILGVDGMIVARKKSLFQTHYFSEKLIAPGIKLGPLDL